MRLHNAAACLVPEQIGDEPRPYPIYCIMYPKMTTNAQELGKMGPHTKYSNYVLVLLAAQGLKQQFYNFNVNLYKEENMNKDLAIRKFTFH